MVGDIEVPGRSARVRERTTPRDAGVPAERMVHRLERYARHPERIDDRIDELDAEWSLERVLAASAATLVLAGLVGGAIVDRRLVALPIVAAAVLLKHALLGPGRPAAQGRPATRERPAATLRRLGVRPRREIERERTALTYLRGDFDGDVATAGGDDRDSVLDDPARSARRALAVADR